MNEIFEGTYEDYLHSKIWKEKRERVLKRYDYRCKKCTAPATEVHHLRYPTFLGMESILDLVPLCRRCHQNEHTAEPHQYTLDKIHVRAISSFLSDEQTQKLQSHYPNKDLHELLISFTEEGGEARQRALYMLNIRTYYGLFDYQRPLSDPLLSREALKQIEDKRKAREEKGARRIRRECGYKN